MLLLITGSVDGTADRIVSKFGEGIFRLNYNLWKEYKVSFTPEFWSIENPAGLKISSETAKNVFWWKAFAYMTDDDLLIKSEIKYFLQDLYGWFETRGLSKGNSINYHNSFGKVNILGLANKYFKIPASIFSIGLDNITHLKNESLIVKSLSSSISSDKQVLMTSKIPSIEKLDKNFPWFIQDEIISDWDVTVFLCGNKVFSFKRSREGLEGIDWRVDQDFEYTKQEWFLFKLSEKQELNIFNLAKELKIEFGRFDFMTSGSSNELVFLEVNASGQWVFLDIHDEYGLLEHVVEWLKK